MGLFEDMSEYAQGAGEKISSKAKEVAATAKYQKNIKSEELKIQQLYYKLGKEYYLKCKDIPDFEVEDLVNEINDCNAIIAENRMKIEEEREKIKNEKKQ